MNDGRICRHTCTTTWHSTWRALFLRGRKVTLGRSDLYVCFKTALCLSSLRNVILALCHIQITFFRHFNIPISKDGLKTGCVYHLLKICLKHVWGNVIIGKKMYYKRTLSNKFLFLSHFCIQACPMHPSRPLNLSRPGRCLVLTGSPSVRTLSSLCQRQRVQGSNKKYGISKKAVPVTRFVNALCYVNLMFCLFRARKTLTHVL